MSRVVCDGNTKVTWFPACASISAPTVAELTAGSAFDLQDLLTPDGLALTIQENEVDMGVLSSTNERSKPGTYKVGMGFTFQRDSTTGSDKAWTTLIRNTEGFIAIRRLVPAATTWAIGDKAEVYTETVGKRFNNAPARNTLQNATVNLYPSGADTDAAVVA